MTLQMEDASAVPLIAYPTQRDAAAMIGISESSLSRDPDAQGEQAGARGLRYRAGEVLAAAAKHGRRSVHEVAAQLLDHAKRNAPVHVDAVRAEIDAYFDTRTPVPLDKHRFLEEARRTLPKRLYEQVKMAYEHGTGEFAVDLVADQDQVAAGEPHPARP